MKRAIAVAMMFFALLPAVAEKIELGPFTYSYSLYTTNATVIAYDGYSTGVDIPSSIVVPEDYWEGGEKHTRYHTIKVTAIGDSAFSRKSFIKSIGIPGSVISIGDSAFSGCAALEGFLGLYGVETIGSSAFYGCSSLKGVRTSEGLKYIGSNVFKNCTSLESAVIEGTGINLWNSMSIFGNCSSLRSVRIGDGIVKLNYYGGFNRRLFDGCSSLESVSIGRGITEIPAYFLYGVGNADKGLSVSLDGQITSVESYAFNNSCITNLVINLSNCTVGNDAFHNCPAVTDDNIDFSQITYVGSSAFYGCTALTGVRTSESLTVMGSRAFSGCTSLESAEIEGTGLEIGVDAFENCTSLKRVIIGDGINGFSTGNITRLYSYTFAGCSSLESVSVGSGVAVVPNYLLYGTGSSSNGMSVLFDGTLSGIGVGAFNNSCITNLALNLSNCTVGQDAFENCPAVTTESIDFSHIIEIGRDAFQNCTNISNEVVFSENLTTIGYYAFANCVNAHDFAFLGAPPSASSSSFNGVKSGAIGTYTAEYEAEWEAVIDSRGYWNGLKMRPSYYTVHYDLNGGSGEIADDVVEYGSEGIKIEVHGVSWANCYLVGWAFEADGEVAYVEGDTIAEPTGDNISVTLYAKWMPVPKLKIKSVDWTEGEISLRWAEADSEEGWWPCTLYRGTTDSLAAAEALPDAQEITATSYVDASFLTATPVTAPLYYWVVPKGVDISQTDIEPVVTRRRHYLCVGNTKYDGKWEADLMDGDADAFAEILEKGGFIGNVLKNVDRDTLRSSIRNAIGECGKGDMFVLYLMAHGGYESSWGNRSCLCMRPYREYYFNTELAADLATADLDTAVISFLPVCHSAAIIDASSILGNTAQVSQDAAQFLNDGLGQCTANMAAIAACSADVSAPTIEGVENTINPITYFCRDAIEKGCADVSPGDGVVTWGELFDYVRGQQELFTYNSVAQMTGNEGMLRKLAIADGVTNGHGCAPSAPSDPVMKIVGDVIEVSWKHVSGADWYVINGNFTRADRDYIITTKNRQLIKTSAFESHVANIIVAAGNAYGRSEWEEADTLQIGKRVCDLSATTSRSDGVVITWSINSPAKACVLSRHYANDPEISLFNDDRLLSIGKHEVYDDKVEAERAVEYTLSVQFEGEEDWVEVTTTGYRKQESNETILELESAPKTIDVEGGYVYVRLRVNGMPVTNHSGDDFCTELANYGEALLLFCERNYGSACRDHTIRFTLGEKELVYTLRQYGTDSLPSVDRDEDVSVVLARSDDGRLRENVTDKKAYEDLRYWMSENGISVEDAEISAHVYPSFVLGTDRLLENEPTIEIGEAKVGAEKTDGLDVDIGTITVSVTVKDGENPIKVAEEKVAALFESTCSLDDWDGESKLTPMVEVLEGEGNTLRFKVKPGDGKVPRAFLRIRK